MIKMTTQRILQRIALMLKSILCPQSHRYRGYISFESHKLSFLEITVLESMLLEQNAYKNRHVVTFPSIEDENIINSNGQHTKKISWLATPLLTIMISRSS